MSFTAVVVGAATAVVAAVRNTTVEALADMPEERWQW
jgi:tRNA(Ile2) C34 agmatinyltransferase TiaS